MYSLKQTTFLLLTVTLLASCTKGNLFNKNPNKNLVTNSGYVNQAATDGNITFQYLSKSALTHQMVAQNIIEPNSTQAQQVLETLPSTDLSSPSNEDQEPMQDDSEEEDSLFLGYPMELLGEYSTFGGVVIEVSEKNEANIGGLRHSSLDPVIVKGVIGKDGSGLSALVLLGCTNNCSESTGLRPVMSFPIVGIDNEKKQIIIDLSAAGTDLDLVTMNGQDTANKLKAVSSTTTSFDLSATTLIFDVKTKMIPEDRAVEDETAPVTSFTVRWFVKLGSVFNPTFESREPISSVGYFQTLRGANSKIKRLVNNEGKSIHYYIKNFPVKYQKHVTDSFDNWNTELKSILKRNSDFFTYEIIPEGDPRNETIISGDVRYNTVEWNKDNNTNNAAHAEVIAHPYTGEIFSTHILFQGQSIIDYYSSWFNGSAAQPSKNKSNTIFELKVGETLEMSIPSQEPEKSEEIERGFDTIPEGLDFDTYIAGFFRQTISHEIGHALGLRHNLKGNLGATADTVSNSILEYLPDNQRHLGKIGEYDHMALAYGYLGVRPTKENIFCTDLQEPTDKTNISTASAECSQYDGTSDPFSYWENRLTHIINLIIAPDSPELSTWKFDELNPDLQGVIIGITAYAMSAENTGHTWIGFFGKFDRPTDKALVKPYVFARLKDLACSDRLVAAPSGKSTPEAQEQAQKDLKNVHRSVDAVLRHLGAATKDDFLCSELYKKN